MTLLSSGHRLTGWVFAGLLLGACGAHNLGTEPPATPAARADSVEGAVGEILNARCDLEDRCGNIAAGAKYERRDICESKMQGATASELNTKDCPLGVDVTRLDACLAMIRAEKCESIFDTLNRWNACRNGAICFK